MPHSRLMCLVPHEAGTVDNFAVVQSDGATSLPWSQTRGGGFDWPV